MLLQVLCDVLFGAIKLLLRLVPRLPSFTGLDTSLAPLFYVLRFVNQFVSLPLVGRCGLIILFVYNLKFGWSIVMWLVRKIPGVS